MNFNETEARGARRWFWGAGAAAVLLSLWLWNVDNRLTNSPRERVLTETLYDLRSAQTSLPTANVDHRLTVELPTLNNSAPGSHSHE